MLDFCGLEDFHDDAVIESAIEDELRHNKSGDQRLREEAAIPAECKKLYLGLRSILASSELRTEIPKNKGRSNLVCRRCLCRRIRFAIGLPLFLTESFCRH